MRFSFTSALVVALAVDVTASSWFTKAAYNKWHETELERWLSDHDIPYPTPADRKDLENLVKSNWNSAIESPYVNWDTARLQKYLSDRGQDVKKGTAQNKDALVSQVKGSWYDAEGAASSAYSDVKKWIFDSWTDSSLKAFCDKHGIPVPQPRTRDALLKTARENYQTVANKAGETAAYPGNWLYQSWSDSELKAWLDERGIPVPQTKRDKLVATVRRNAYIASRNTADARDRAAEATFNAWSDSELKAWADKNGIKVPQGSNRNELLAIARKNVAKLTGDNVSYSASSAASKASASAASAYGAATTKAGNEFAKATDDASLKADDLYAKASSVVVSIYTEVQILLGVKTNYLSSASKSLSSVSAKASAKAEL